jgi:hypothetical protein
MKLLVIDDTLAELQKGVAVGERNGCMTYGISPVDPTQNIPERLKDHPFQNWQVALKFVDAVVTDLMWSTQPNGIMVVLEAVRLGKPVVICTNGRDEEGGHNDEIAFVLNYFNAFGVFNPGCTEPFGLVVEKNWDKAVEEVLKRFHQE